MKRFIEIISTPRIGYFDCIYLGPFLSELHDKNYATAAIILIVGAVIGAAMRVWIEFDKQGETK